MTTRRAQVIGRADTYEKEGFSDVVLIDRDDIYPGAIEVRVGAAFTVVDACDLVDGIDAISPDEEK